MDDTNTPAGERAPSAPPAVAEPADEATLPGDNEVTVQMPGRAATSAGEPAASGDPSAARAVATPEPTGPTVPALPGYPGAASLPLAPALPTYATAPALGGDQPTYPSLPGFAPAYEPRPQPPVSYPLGRILRRGKPLPLWQSLAIAVGSLAAVCLTYSAAELLGHADWADGARTAGIVALILAAVVIAGAALRYRRGRRAGSMLALAAVLAASLGAGGGIAVAASPALHTAQARQLERDHQWQAAVNEYRLAGETPPNAPDIARVLDESGEALLAQHDYAGALKVFNSVVSQFTNGGPLVDRASKGRYDAYVGLIQATGPTTPYADAIAFFTSYRASAACDATCRTDAANAEAQARYQYGQALAAAARYQDAITQFTAVTSSLASSPYAPKAHAAAATAYLAVGKQQLGQDCADAIPTYQTLAKDYGDTPEGKQAHAALAAPQTVTGHIYHAPGNPAPSIYLSKSVNPNAYYFSNEYQASFDVTSGLFTFRNVAQGKYYLNLIRDDGSYIHYIWYGRDGPAVDVGPLCPVDWGNDFYTEK